MKGKKEKTDDVSENEEEEKNRAELHESDEIIEAAEISNDWDAVGSETEAITSQTGDIKPCDHESSIPKEYKVAEELELQVEVDEKRVMTSSGFRRHAALVAAEQ